MGERDRTKLGGVPVSKLKIIEFPIFSGYLVHVEVTSDIFKSMRKYPCTRGISQEDLKNTHAMCVHDDDGHHTFVFLHPSASAGTITHESWNVVRRMFKVMGVKLDSETVAYHLGYLVDQIFRFMRGRR